ncbi:MAG: sigma-70 family RNA polymerase sigma factor [Polyangiales bacterium]
MAPRLTESARDELVRGHVEMVPRIARKVHREMPAWVRVEDLVGAGHEGLLDAARRFDPDRGAPFHHYAYYRVRGSRIDWVRQAASHDPVARARTHAHAAVDDLLQTVAGEHDLAAVSPEGAASLLVSALQEAATAYALAEIAEETRAQPGEDPEAAAARRETGTVLARAVDGLPARERDILRGVYFDGRTIEQSGAEMGLTKGWASRLHARALALLRAALAEMEAHLGAEG